MVPVAGEECEAVTVGSWYENAAEVSEVTYCLPLVSREWKNGSNSSYNCIPFLHSLLTKGKIAGFTKEATGTRLRTVAQGILFSSGWMLSLEGYKSSQLM